MASQGTEQGETLLSSKKKIGNSPDATIGNSVYSLTTCLRTEGVTMRAAAGLSIIGLVCFT